MFYIRLILLGFWIIICCLTGLAKSVLRWRDPSLGSEFGRMYSWGALRITGISVEVQGREFLEAYQPCIYVVNHQSNFDMGVYGILYPRNTVIIGKKELIWLPLFGLFYLASGNIMIDRSKTDKAKGILSQVVGEIEKRRVSVWVFPEGTRNRSGKGLLPFKKGSFHMAVAAQVPIIPLVASSMPPVADFRAKKIPGGRMQVRVLPPVPTAGLTENDVTALTEDVREKMLAALQELHSVSNEQLRMEETVNKS